MRSFLVIKGHKGKEPMSFFLGVLGVLCVDETRERG